MFVGWDWASAAHDVTVVDGDGNVLDRWAVTHDVKGIEGALLRLRRHGSPADLPVAIESTRSLVIDRLLDAGHPVVHGLI
ncbi:MAG: IS110 family transposase [Actinomycetota bacterium]